jgi:hypothetical protein
MGRTILLLGPLGIGKTSVLTELCRRLACRGVPCGFAPNTAHLADVTAALLRAHPGAATMELDQRHLRSRLRLAVEAEPGALLLDHVAHAGTAMKSFLRSLRGTGLGVVLAADVKNGRCHAMVRELHLAHLEIVAPPLSGPSMAALFRDLLTGCTSFETLHDDDRRRLLQLARGNPGRLVTYVHLLTDARYWRAGRVLVPTVDATATTLSLERWQKVEMRG